MQNAQNTEIQQRVMNLVNRYRTKVGKESEIAKAAKADSDFWEQESVNMVIEEGLPAGGIYGTGPHTEVWTKYLMVNEQLLGHFYAEVAGKDAEQSVLDQLLPNVYDKTVFTEEEECFLKSHFKEMVNYIILTPCDDSLEWVHSYDSKDALTIPSEVMGLIGSRLELEKGSKIYYPNAGFAQLTNLFKDSKFFCSGDNAWMRVAVYANGIDAEFVDGKMTQQSYDAIVSYIPSEDWWSIKHICEVFENLSQSGKLILLCQSSVLAAKDNSSKKRRLTKTLEYKENLLVRNELEEDTVWEDACASFRRIMVEDGTIKEIIQLPQVMSNNASSDTYCLLIAEKGQEDSDVTLIDARTAFIDLDARHFGLSFDMAKFDAILKNGGKDPNTGLRKVVKISNENMSRHMLVPQVYTIARPSEIEHPVPLSSLCKLESTLVRDVQFDLPEETPWITMSDLTPLFTGDLNMSDIRKADCPNRPSFVEGSKDYAFDKDGKFVDSIWSQVKTTKGYRVLDYRNCTYVDGNNDVILYERNPEDGVRMALVRATDRPFAVSKKILVFSSEKGTDAQTLMAILRLPIVYRQLLAYQKFGIGAHLDDILVPTDKRVIGDELARMKKEKTVTKEMNEDFEAGQNKYMTKLEDYQHAMRKHIREISSSVRRMERFINGMESSEEIKVFLHERLEVIKTHRLYLSEDIERLNEENTYGKAVPFDIDHCLKGFKYYFGSDAYPIAYSNEVSKEVLKQYVESHRKELNDMNEVDRSKTINRINEEKSFVYVDIAEYNFCKVVRNILENARIHGFSTDTSRDDYTIEIVLSWDSERKMYQIDFRNNGDPLPDGLSKESYGENRKYAGKTGGTGIGGYEVADTVKHYNGDYAISQDGDWVVVSIFLPKSKSYEESV